MGKLTEYQQVSYRANGYIVLKGLLTAEELEAISEAHDLLFRTKEIETTPSSCVGPDENASKNDTEYTVKSIPDVQYHSAAFSRFLLNARLLDALEDVMATGDIALHHTEALYEPPHTDPAAYPMYQNYHYFPHEKDSLVTALLHLDAANTEGGGLVVYPGSHRLGALHHAGASEGSRHSVYQNKFPLSGATPVVAERGDVVIFSYLLVHGSSANASPRARRALLTQFAAAGDVPRGVQPQRPGQGWLVKGDKFNRDDTIAKGLDQQ